MQDANVPSDCVYENAFSAVSFVSSITPHLLHYFAPAYDQAFSVHIT
jgi:hypothetical protein